MCVDDKMVKLQIWDTAGQEKYRSLISNYLREASVAVVVYDVTSNITITLDKESFHAIHKWVSDARNLQGEDLQVVLVGNKTDLEESRMTSTKEGERLAKELQIGFIETSSKTGSNIHELFKKVAASLPGLEGAEIIDNKDCKNHD